MSHKSHGFHNEPQSWYPKACESGWTRLVSATSYFNDNTKKNETLDGKQKNKKHLVKFISLSVSIGNEITDE
jgi:hypothetical protein